MKSFFILALLFVNTAFAETREYVFTQSQTLNFSTSRSPEVVVHGLTPEGETVVVSIYACYGIPFKQAQLYFSVGTGLNFIMGSASSYYRKYESSDKCILQTNLLKSASPKSPVIVSITDDGSFDIYRASKRPEQ